MLYELVIYYVYMNKSLIWLGAFVGSTAGSALPLLWHDSYFSVSSVLLSGVGGVLGIIAAYQINRRYF